MNKKQLDDYLWLQHCKSYMKYLEYKMINDISMSSIEIEIWNLTPTKLSDVENKEIVEVLNNFDPLRVIGDK